MEVLINDSLFPQKASPEAASKQGTDISKHPQPSPLLAHIPSGPPFRAPYLNNEDENISDSRRNCLKVIPDGQSCSAQPFNPNKSSSSVTAPDNPDHEFPGFSTLKSGPHSSDTCASISPLAMLRDLMPPLQLIPPLASPLVLSANPLSPLQHTSTPFQLSPKPPPLGTLAGLEVTPAGQQVTPPSAAFAAAATSAMKPPSASKAPTPHTCAKATISLTPSPSPLQVVLPPPTGTLASLEVTPQSSPIKTIINNPNTKTLQLNHVTTISSEPQSWAISSEPQSWAISSEPQALAISSEPQASAISSEPQALAISSEPQALAISSEPQALAHIMLLDFHPGHPTTQAKATGHACSIMMKAKQEGHGVDQAATAVFSVDMKSQRRVSTMSSEAAPEYGAKAIMVHPDDNYDVLPEAARRRTAASPKHSPSSVEETMAPVSAVTAAPTAQPSVTAGSGAPAAVFTTPAMNGTASPFRGTIPSIQASPPSFSVTLSGVVHELLSSTPQHLTRAVSSTPAATGTKGLEPSTAAAAAAAAAATGTKGLKSYTAATGTPGLEPSTAAAAGTPCLKFSAAATGTPFLKFSAAAAAAAGSPGLKFSAAATGTPGLKSSSATASFIPHQGPAVESNLLASTPCCSRAGKLNLAAAEAGPTSCFCSPSLSELACLAGAGAAGISSTPFMPQSTAAMVVPKGQQYRGISSAWAASAPGRLAGSRTGSRLYNISHDDMIFLSPTVEDPACTNTAFTSGKSALLNATPSCAPSTQGTTDGTAGANTAITAARSSTYHQGTCTLSEDLGTAVGQLYESRPPSVAPGLMVPSCLAFCGAGGAAALCDFTPGTRRPCTAEAQSVNNLSLKSVVGDGSKSQAVSAASGRKMNDEDYDEPSRVMPFMCDGTPSHVGRHIMGSTADRVVSDSIHLHAIMPALVVEADSAAAETGDDNCAGMRTVVRKQYCNTHRPSTADGPPNVLNTAVRGGSGHARGATLAVLQALQVVPGTAVRVPVTSSLHPPHGPAGYRNSRQLQLGQDAMDGIGNGDSFTPAATASNKARPVAMTATKLSGLSCIIEDDEPLHDEETAQVLGMRESGAEIMSSSSVLPALRQEQGQDSNSHPNQLMMPAILVSTQKVGVGGQNSLSASRTVVPTKPMLYKGSTVVPAGPSNYSCSHLDVISNSMSSPAPPDSVAQSQIPSKHSSLNGVCGCSLNMRGDYSVEEDVADEEDVAVRLHKKPFLEIGGGLKERVGCTTTAGIVIPDSSRPGDADVAHLSSEPYSEDLLNSAEGITGLVSMHHHHHHHSTVRRIGSSADLQLSKGRGEAKSLSAKEEDQQSLHQDGSREVPPAIDQHDTTTQGGVHKATKDAQEVVIPVLNTMLPEDRLVPAARKTCSHQHHLADNHAAVPNNYHTSSSKPPNPVRRCSTKQRRSQNLALHSSSIPAQAVHSSSLPAQAVHSSSLPAQAVHSSSLPAQAVHSSSLPAQAVHSSSLPAQAVHSSSLPAQAVHSSSLPAQGVHSSSLPAQALHSSSLPAQALHISLPIIEKTHESSGATAGHRQLSFVAEEQCDMTSLKTAVHEASGSAVARVKSQKRRASKRTKPTHVSSSTCPLTVLGSEEKSSSRRFKTKAEEAVAAPMAPSSSSALEEAVAAPMAPSSSALEEAVSRSVTSGLRRGSRGKRAPITGAAGGSLLEPLPTTAAVELIIITTEEVPAEVVSVVVEAKPSSHHNRKREPPTGDSSGTTASTIKQLKKRGREERPPIAANSVEACCLLPSTSGHANDRRAARRKEGGEKATAALLVSAHAQPTQRASGITDAKEEGTCTSVRRSRSTTTSDVHVPAAVMEDKQPSRRRAKKEALELVAEAATLHHMEVAASPPERVTLTVRRSRRTATSHASSQQQQHEEAIPACASMHSSLPGGGAAAAVVGEVHSGALLPSSASRKKGHMCVLPSSNDLRGTASEKKEGACGVNKVKRARHNRDSAEKSDVPESPQQHSRSRRLRAMSTVDTAQRKRKIQSEQSVGIIIEEGHVVATRRRVKE
ncbi:hypothetical protein CEUSTIGMA_g12456.t1 [Chlamydomonas eustigma]|uniref:Uncharacterized protein n=1 Tax=Chlamydomonas eustigma TaxID=1157962 RepID=A0A250XPR5_9CHLO|nr:hypothetical protein CEUSTIGMA_g12456.t1 [Chlamydomonas eustigma]|eukprot:GAX85036.1 hypothetical protein CEUSTIGMA_g12456.t1 [Chlamydomonas eustigma]